MWTLPTSWASDREAIFSTNSPLYSVRSVVFCVYVCIYGEYMIYDHIHTLKLGGRTLYSAELARFMASLPDANDVHNAT